MRALHLFSLVTLGSFAAIGCVEDRGGLEPAVTEGGEALSMLAPSNMPVMLLTDAQIAEILKPPDDAEREPAQAAGVDAREPEERVFAPELIQEHAISKPAEAMVGTPTGTKLVDALKCQEL